MYYTREELIKYYENNKHISSISKVKYNNEIYYFCKLMNNSEYDYFDDDCDDCYYTKHKIIGKYYFMCKFYEYNKVSNYLPLCPEFFCRKKEIIFDLYDSYIVFFKKFDEAIKFKTKIIKFDCDEEDNRSRTNCREDNLIKNIYMKKFGNLIYDLHQYIIGNFIKYENKTYCHEGKSYKNLYLLKFK